MNINHNNFSSIEQMTYKLGGKVITDRSHQEAPDQSFFDILQAANEESTSVKFSKHANERLSSRNIELSTSQMERLNNGTQMARSKGIKESLVCVDDYSFIVNVRNNMVVTALSREDEKVFTNIDGAVII